MTALPTELAAALEALASHAGLGGDPAAFAAWLAPRCADVERHPDARYLADLLIVYRCEHRHADSWRTVAEELERLSATALRRFRQGSSFASEVCSRTLSRLVEVEAASASPRLCRYLGRGPLGAWLRAVLIREAIDAARAARDDQLRSSLDGFAHGAAPVLDELMRGELAPVVHDALRTALSTLSARERTIVRCRYVDGATVGEIAALLGVHRATATRTLAEIQERLRQHVRATICADQRVTATELDSIVRMIADDLDSSLRCVLADVGDRTE